VVINNGSDSTTGLSRITYLKFDPNDDFNTVGADPFPSGTIISATLRLVGVVATGTDTPPGPKNDQAFGVEDATWGESTMTFNTRPTVDGNILDTQSISGALKAYTWNVTNWVTSHAPAVFSVAVKEADTAALRHFYRSKEYTTAADRPQVIFSVGAPDAPTGVTATPGNGQITLNWSLTTASGFRVDASSGRSTAAPLAVREHRRAAHRHHHIPTHRLQRRDYFYYVVGTNSVETQPIGGSGSVRPWSSGPACQSHQGYRGIRHRSVVGSGFHSPIAAHRSDVPGGPLLSRPTVLTSRYRRRALSFTSRLNNPAAKGPPPETPTAGTRGGRESRLTITTISISRAPRFRESNPPSILTGMSAVTPTPIRWGGLQIRA
jgi:hypothetical protein